MPASTRKSARVSAQPSTTKPSATKPSATKPSAAKASASRPSGAKQSAAKASRAESFGAEGLSVEDSQSLSSLTLTPSELEGLSETEIAVRKVEIAEKALSFLISKPAQLLSPSEDVRDKVVRASELLFAVAGGVGFQGAEGLGSEELVTEGCDAEQIWGQLELRAEGLSKKLKRRVKELAAEQDTQLFEDSDVDMDDGEGDDIDMGDEEDEDEMDEEDDESDDEAAEMAAAMRREVRALRGREAEGLEGQEDEEDEDDEEDFEALKDDYEGSEGSGEEGLEDEDDEEEDDEAEEFSDEDEGPPAKGSKAKKGKEPGAKSKKKGGEEKDPFFDMDEMERFVRQAEEEEEDDDEDVDFEDDEEGEEASGKRARKRPRDVLEEDEADEVEFIVSGAGEEDIDGIYRREAKQFKFGVAYTNGDNVLLFEKAGTKLSKGKISKSRWIIFSDENGVHGDKPYYEAVGSFSQGFSAQWKSIQGASPGPSVSWRRAGDDSLLNQDEDDDEEEAAWEEESDDEEDDEESGAERPRKSAKGGAKEAKFSDFFDPIDKKSKAKASLEEEEGAPFISAETFQGSREGYVFKMGESGLGYYFDGPFEVVAKAEDDAKKSRHGKEMAAKEAEILEMEGMIAQPRDWMLQGEVSVAKRPANSLLELNLDFDQATKRAPVVTQEVTESLEDLIKRRCIDQQWDDVVRKIPEEQKKKRELEEINEEKSNKGLGDIYAEEYEKQILGAKEPDAMAKQHAEVEGIFAKLCNRLDALSNFHFTPKNVVEDMTVRPNVPAIKMEEVVPMGVNDSQLLAPEEVYAAKKKTKELKSQEEKTSEERKRERMRKKRVKKAKIQKKNAELKAQGKAVPVQTSSLPAKKGKEEGTKDSKHKPGDLAKSSTLFRALQEEALGTIKTYKADKEGKSTKAHKSAGSFKL